MINSLPNLLKTCGTSFQISSMS